MRLFSIFAIAIAAVSATPVANHVEGTWTISKFSFCRGQSEYDYSFAIKGTANGKTPAFSGTCSNTNGKVFYQCTSKPSGAQDFNLFAKTKIVKGKPEVTIETVQIANGCRYQGLGSIIIDDAKCAGKLGEKYRIAPKDSKECNA